MMAEASLLMINPVALKESNSQSILHHVMPLRYMYKHLMLSCWIERRKGLRTQLSGARFVYRSKSL